MPNVAELGRELDRKRGELHGIFEKCKLAGQVDPETGAQLFDPDMMDGPMIEEVQRRNAELKELNDQYETARLSDIMSRNNEEAQRLRTMDRKLSGPGISAPRNMNGEVPKLSEKFFANPAYKMRGNNPRRFGMDLDDIDVKTLMSLTAGYAPANPRTARVVLSAQRRPVISDLIPTDTTTNQVIKWMEETTFTNNASTVSEGGYKAESALAFTERTATVQKIATFLPVTEEQLDDIAQMTNLLDNRLTLMVLIAEENQLLYGQGNSPNLDGFMHFSGTQTQAFDTNNADTFYKAFTKVRWTGFGEPSGIVMHPDNWQTIRLMKTSGSGEYILGDPMSDVEARLWGKPVVITPAIATGTGLTGDFVLYSHISRKLGLRVDISDSHLDYFQRNLLAIRAEMRESLEIYRAAAFCKVSGLT